MTAVPTPGAYDAIAGLSKMPNLAETDATLTAIAPGGDGLLQGYELALTRAATTELAATGQATRDRLQDSGLVAYEPAQLIPAQHWMHVTVPEAALLSHTQTLAQAHDNPAFDPGADYARNIKLLAARFVDTQDREVVFYRVQETLAQFKKGRALGLLLRDGVWNLVAPENLLLLKPTFDLVVVDGYAFFASKSAFERAFGFVDKLRAESQATFTKVTSHLSIQGMDEFERACTTQPQMMAKMSSIRRSMDTEPAYAAAMTTDNLISYISSHPHVDIDVVEHDGTKQLAFDPHPKRRYQIVKLLDDDFLRSTLTERDYESSAKTVTS